MSRILLCVLCLGLFGCLDKWPPTQVIPIEEVDAVVEAWQDAGLPYGSWCEWQRSSAFWVELDLSQAEEVCHQSEGLQGCILLPQPYVVVVEGAPAGKVRVHELIHWLDYCSTSSVDYDHTNKALWDVERVALDKLAY